ncbi:rod shape-determining protein MreD [Alcanivorax sp. S71-1-4]|nr:rod shape-determining protein MreD [Alcanivorax sp. S71-1-4]
MRERKASGTGAILVTILLAGLLAILPLPEALALGRPEWLTLVLIYWVIALPQRIGVFWGFGVGLFQDVLTGSVLGQHAIALAVVAYIALAVHRGVPATAAGGGGVSAHRHRQPAGLHRTECGGAGAVAAGLGAVAGTGVGADLAPGVRRVAVDPAPFSGALNARAVPGLRLATAR